MKKYWFGFYTEVAIEGKDFNEAEDTFWEEAKKLKKVFPIMKEVIMETYEEAEEREVEKWK